MAKTAKTVREYLLMTLGTLLLSIGVYFFKIPNGFSTGGVSGISTILGRLTPTISSATWLMLINVALLVVGALVLGKSNGIRTVYCSLMYSAMTYVFERIVPMSAPLTDESLLELVYAMILTSVGSAVIFNNAASSGGTDIIALILRKYTKLDVGKSLLVTDFVIAASSFAVFGVKAGLFSLLGLFAKAFIVDAIIDTINSFKYFIVITDHDTEIGEYILSELHHGATVTDAIGSYTGDKKKMLHTVCKRIEAVRLRKRIKQIDPHAFTIITTSNEIVGRGFRAV